MSLDQFIGGFRAKPDGDLMLCESQGVAYQRDRDHRVTYGAEYFDKCRSYEDQSIAKEINAGRVALVQRHFGLGRVLDIGVGSGEFIKKRGNTFGHDVNPVAAEWLKRAGLWSESLDGFGAFTFWDVLEHVPDPGDYLRKVGLHCYVFVSLPVFERLREIRASRHYRPGEHLYYWTPAGFVSWMWMHGFLCLERNEFETEAGRESIQSFAFRRNRWPTQYRFD